MTYRLRRVHDLDLVATPEAHDWRDDAACAGAVCDPSHPAEPSWWDVISSKRTEPEPANEPAIKVCDGCPVTGHCLTTAHPRHDRYSIRAGMLPAAWRGAKRDQAGAA